MQIVLEFLSMLEDTLRSSHKKVKVTGGPSCEHCHGAASEWIDVHNTNEEREIRIKKATKKGMRSGQELLGLSYRCMGCHGFTHVKPEYAEIMLEAGHPLNPDWEFVQYSQGTNRHFLVADRKPTLDELKLKFVLAQASALVNATKNLGKGIKNAKYNEAQYHRVAKARKVLKLTGMAAALLQKPTIGNAKKFHRAVRTRKLPASIDKLLPKSYK